MKAKFVTSEGKELAPLHTIDAKPEEGDVVMVDTDAFVVSDIYTQCDSGNGKQGYDGSKAGAQTYSVITLDPKPKDHVKKKKGEKTEKGEKAD